MKLLAVESPGVAVHFMRTPAGVLVFALAIFLVYLAGIDIQYYQDDFEWIDPSSSVVDHFIRVNPANGWYRPIQASFLALVQRHFDLNTVPIHLASILIHALLCYWILVALIRTGYPPVHAILASAFMAFSQANAFALLSDDTLSQVLGTFFGCLSLWALLCRNKVAERPGNVHVGPYRLSVALFALALLSKEASVSFFPMLLCMLLLQNKTADRNAVAVKKFIGEAVPYGAVLAVYLTIRWLAGAQQPGLGPARYQFRIGLNIFKNFALDLFALTVPASSVTAFEAFNAGDAARFGLIAACSLAFLCAVAYGLVLCARRDKKIIVAAIFLIASSLPMIMLNHVSELYVYNSMPFFSVLVGIGVGALWENYKRSPVRHAVVALFIVMLASHVMAIRDKASLMRENGERAAVWIREIGPYMDRVPKNGELLLLNPPNNRVVEYSGYRMNGFNVLEYGEPFIKKRYGREDIGVRIVEPSDLGSAKQRPNVLILGLEGENLDRITPNPG
jgi:hypothetical protein